MPAHKFIISGNHPIFEYVTKIRYNQKAANQIKASLEKLGYEVSVTKQEFVAADKTQNPPLNNFTKKQERWLDKQLKEIELGQASINHLVTMLDWRITLVRDYVRWAKITPTKKQRKSFGRLLALLRSPTSKRSRASKSS